MVVGGFSSWEKDYLESKAKGLNKNKGKLTNDIELVTNQKKFKSCSKAVKPLFLEKIINEEGFPEEVGKSNF